MLIGCLVFVVDEALRKLVQKVSSHTHDFSLIHAFSNFAVIGCTIVLDVSLEELVLLLHLDECLRFCLCGFVKLSLMLYLRVLITLFNLSLFQKESTKH